MICVVLGLLSVEAVSVLCYAAFVHAIVPVLCCTYGDAEGN